MSIDPSEQRREAFRVDVRLRVEVNHPRIRDGWLVNLSASGALLDVDLECEPGDGVQFSIMLADEDPIPLAAEVVRRKDTRVAVKFIGLGLGSDREVAHIVFAEHRRRLKPR